MNIGNLWIQDRDARKDMLPLSIELQPPACLSNAYASLSQQLVGMSLQFPVVMFQIFATAYFLFVDHTLTIEILFACQVMCTLSVCRLWLLDIQMQETEQ